MISSKNAPNNRCNIAA